LSEYIRKDWDGDHGGTEDNGWEGDDLNLYPSAGSDYLDDVALYLRDHDGWPDDDTYPGVQNVSTYTVGFNADLDLLRDAAKNGGGTYYASDDSAGLNQALQQIVNQIISVSTAYTAPVVPISQMERTSSGDRIYVASFKPLDKSFWKGNIKRYRLAMTADPDRGIAVGDILDQNGDLATNSTGYILDSAYSYWNPGDTPDGGEVEPGGSVSFFWIRI
jgi:type IV pilus assembly protein PilY1